MAEGTDLKRRTSGLGTFGKTCGPFTFSTFVPSPLHLQVSSLPPSLTLPPPQPFLSSQDSPLTALANHPSCVSSSSPTFW